MICFRIPNVKNSSFFSSLLAPKDCSGPIDIGFLVDASASMSNGYSKELKFVDMLAGKYNLSPDGNHATTVIYSNNARVFIPLSEGTDPATFSKKIVTAPYLGQDTRFERALYMSRIALMDPKHGARSRIPKLLFVLTDGRQSNPDAGNSVANMAAELHDLGVHVFVIVIGDAYDEAEINRIASMKTSVYYTKDMNELAQPDTVSYIQSLTCPHLGM